MSETKPLAGQARRLAAEYRGSPLQAHREVSDVLSKLAAENERLRSMPNADEIRLAIQWWQAQDYDTEEGQQAAVELANLLRRVASVLGRGAEPM